MLMVHFSRGALLGCLAAVAACGPLARPAARPPTAEESVWLAAREALRHAQASAASCARSGAPDVVVHVTTTFGPDGRVASAEATGVPGADASVTECVLALVRAEAITPFTGERPTEHVDFVVAPESPVLESAAPFDRGAASATLGQAAGSLRKLCEGSGQGHVRVYFETDGTVKRALVDEPRHAGRPVGACIEDVFRRARVPPFRGTKVSVGKSYSLD